MEFPQTDPTKLPLAGGTMNVGSQIKIADGAAATPGLATTTDATSGIYREPTDPSGVTRPIAIAISGAFVAGWSSVGYVQSIIGGASSTFSVLGESTVQMTSRRFSNNVTAPSLQLGKARGTIALPTVPQTSDVLGQITSQMYSGSTFTASGQIIATCIETSTVDTTHLGTRWTFSACPIGSGTVTEIMRLETATGLSMFGANIVIDANRVFRRRVFTVATLPAGVIGMSSFVSDALGPAFGAAVVGGGAVQIPVYYDGAWKVG